MAENDNKYINLGNLTTYDAKIKEYINNKDTELSDRITTLANDLAEAGVVLEWTDL